MRKLDRLLVVVPTRRAKSSDEARPLAGSPLAGRSPDPDGGTDPRGRVVRNTPIRVVPEPLAPTSVCGAFGPSGRSAWGCHGSGGDGFREAQDELVEIGGRRYRVHPAAVFPIMSGREFDEMVEDVRVNGRANRSWCAATRLVDGRNRGRACAAVGVVPEVRQLERGTDVASWVMSVNVHRRHLDASQRALLASRLSLSSGTSLWRSSPTGFQGCAFSSCLERAHEVRARGAPRRTGAGRRRRGQQRERGRRQRGGVVG